jgi:predicted phage terminase large subunit-like protein
MSDISKLEAQAILRHDLYAFHVKALKTTMPNVEFLSNWHILAMCAAIEELIRGDVPGLIINIQPRMGKSLLCSVTLPMFMLMRDPALKVMCVSYADHLAAQFHQLSRILSKENWFRELNRGLDFKAAGDSSVLKETGNLLQTTALGHRMSKSFNGSITGMGADLIVADDANDMSLINSEAHRQKINDIFDQTISTRLNNDKGRMLIVTQRGHVDDLTGHLIEKGGFKLLSIEAVATADTDYELGNGKIYTRKKGELIDPRRFGNEYMAGLKNSLGTAAFEAQYQQNPQPPAGNLFKRDWLHVVDATPDSHYVVISCDIASSQDRGDYSAFLVWGFANDIWHLIAAHRVQLEQPGVINFYKKLDQQYEPDLTIIEQNGSGLGVLQILRADGFTHVQGQTVSGDKRQRAENITSLIESKQVAFLRTMPLYDQFMNELLTFPSSKYDDMVDAFTLALTYRNDILRMANSYRRLKRQHLPSNYGSLPVFRLASLNASSTVRDKYFERNGRGVFERW